MKDHPKQRNFEGVDDRVSGASSPPASSLKPQASGRQAFAHARRVVVKVGSGVLTGPSGLNLDVMRSLAGQIAGLMDSGREVILVSSGAVASGMRALSLASRPASIPERQAVAAVGQAGLILEWETAFGAHGKKVAQVLLTRDDLSSRKRYLNARNTLSTLLSWGIAPVINENDTVVVDELKFGDNDNLSAMIAQLLDADVLVNLTDIDGLFDKDPRKHADACLIPVVDRVTRQVEDMACELPGALGTGGMASKIKAARKACAAGIPAVVARGSDPGILTRLFSGEAAGTFFVPNSHKMASRKCWIGFAIKPRGALVLDQGAVKAVVRDKKSLLPAGVRGVEGEFSQGAAVECRDPDGKVLGVGLVNYSSTDIRAILGKKTGEIANILGEKPYDEVIHRDNLVVPEG